MEFHGDVSRRNLGSASNHSGGDAFSSGRWACYDLIAVDSCVVLQMRIHVFEG